jgi:hypothetical protein
MGCERCCCMSTVLYPMYIGNACLLACVMRAWVPPDPRRAFLPFSVPSLDVWQISDGPWPLAPLDRPAREAAQQFK